MLEDYMNKFHDQLLRHGFIEIPSIDPHRAQSYSMADEDRITVTVDLCGNLASFWIQRPTSESEIKVEYQGQARDVREIPALLGKMMAQLIERGGICGKHQD